MGIGGSIFLIAVGAILAFAVHVSVGWLSLNVVGYVLMLAGLVGLRWIKRGSVYGSSDATGSSPKENGMHPTQILATVYHALGIDPGTIVYNHLNQPRELVKADAVTELFG